MYNALIIVSLFISKASTVSMKKRLACALAH